MPKLPAFKFFTKQMVNDIFLSIHHMKKKLHFRVQHYILDLNYNAFEEKRQPRKWNHNTFTNFSNVAKSKGTCAFRG